MTLLDDSPSLQINPEIQQPDNLQKKRHCLLCIKLYLTGLGLLLGLTPLLAQEAEKCYTTLYNQQVHVGQNFAGQQVFEDWLTPLAQKNHLQRHLRQQTQVYRIPVVIHIIHDGEPIGQGANLTDKAIKEQIAMLNKDFRRWNVDTVHTPAVFRSVAADTYIEFELASQDPNGAPTTGIVRKDGSHLNIIDSVKSFSYWPAEQYLNIWVRDFKLRTKGLAGYAQLPVSHMPGLPAADNNRLTDGIVINAPYFGNNPDTESLGRTLVHEMGHFLGLIHIWGNSPAGQDGCLSDDYCSDTPNTQGPNYDCSASVSACDAHERPMPENFMDYSKDACMNLFTAAQAVRMRTVLENSPRRASLLISPGLSPVLPPDTAADNTVKIYPNPGNGEFTLLIQARDEQSIELEVVNSIGEIMLTDHFYQKQPLLTYAANLMHIPSGVYIVKLRGEKFSVAKRVVLIN